MKVRVKLIGIPKPPPGFQGQKEVSMDFSGNSVKDFIDQLISRIGSENRDLFFSDHGDISPDLAINVNGIAISYSSRSDFRLKENDLIELVSAPG
ncbi:MAG: MoaD/ThiS family protein [Deltaproteobacteria bacterium]|nr:MoaD/ThiS family protein [Deltaproteobacteria bacterium]